MTDVNMLYDLQKVDVNWEKVRRKLLALQKALLEPEELIAVRKGVEAVNADIHQWHAQQKDAELESQGLADRIVATDQKLMSGAIRNPKELDALQLSLEGMRKLRSHVDENGVVAMLRVEELTSQQAAQRESLKRLESEWQQRRTELLEEELKVKRIALQLRSHRTKLLESIPGPDLEHYEDLRKRKAGIAIAAIDNGLCTACNVRLPTGVVSGAKARSALVYCPSCGRILVSN